MAIGRILLVCRSIISIKQIDLISEEQKVLANINAITLDIVNSKIEGNNLIYRWFVDSYTGIHASFTTTSIFPI